MQEKKDVVRLSFRLKQWGRAGKSLEFQEDRAGEAGGRQASSASEDSEGAQANRSINSVSTFERWSQLGEARLGGAKLEAGRPRRIYSRVQGLQAK